MTKDFRNKVTGKSKKVAIRQERPNILGKNQKWKVRQWRKQQ